MWSFLTLFSFLLAVSFQLLPQESPVDELMKEVFVNRDAGYRRLASLSFIEDETISVTTSRGGNLADRKAAFIWRGSAGELVRSPLEINGVEASAQEKRRYEKEWLEEGRAGKRRADIAEDSFFHFDYEPGRYFLVDRKEKAGRDTAVIEYYPLRHFQENGRDPIGSRGDEYDRAFDKTSRVVFFIDMEDKQIASIRFSNASLDYLPYNWLAKVDQLDISIAYQRFEPGFWVPEKQVLKTSITDAGTERKIAVLREFHDYARSEVKVDFEVLEQEERKE